MIKRRVIAYLIDYTILFCFIYIFRIAMQFYLDVNIKNFYYLLISLIATVFIFSSYIPTKNNGQTIGKKLLKIRTVKENNSSLNYVQNFIHEFVLKFSLAIIFVPVTIVYFIIYNVIKYHDIDKPLPHEVLLGIKTI